MTEANVIAAVKARMADIAPEGQTHVTSGDYINSLINECLYNFYLIAPNHVLSPTDFSENDVVPVVNTGYGVSVYRIELPIDFIKLLEFKLDTWIRPVMAAIRQGEERHKLQLNEFSFGGNFKPVVTLVSDDAGKGLEFYVYPSEDEPIIEKATCVSTGSITDMPDTLIDAYAWFVASAAFQGMEEIELSEKAQERAIGYLKLL